MSIISLKSVLKVIKKTITDKNKPRRDKKRINIRRTFFQGGDNMKKKFIIALAVVFILVSGLFFYCGGY
jgi:hypothetical protein